MRKIFVLLTLLALAVCLCVSAGAEETSDGFTYIPLEDGTLSITGCSLEGDVVIPPAIGGRTVTNLARELFYGRGGITSVSIPNTVTYFGEDRMDNMWDYVFSYCFDLQSITVDSANPAFRSEDGVLYTRDGKHLINYPAAKAGTVFHVPASVEDLYCTAFASARNLTSLYLDGAETWWYTYTFYNDGGLTVYYQPGGRTEAKVNLEKEGGRSRESSELWPVYTAESGSGTGTGDPSGEDSQTELEKKVEWVVANYTNASMTEEQKALALHDWLTENAYYDTTYASPNGHVAEGVLLDGTGVCDSYAKAYEMLLTKAGVRSIRVTGTAQEPDDPSPESHTWTLVQMGGTWYQVDVTWDDPTGGPDQAKSGLETRQYFKASRQVMDATHFPDEESKMLMDNLLGAEDVSDGWKQEGDAWIYVENGGPVTDWKEIDGAYYCFDENGHMRTGWYEENGYTYYLGTDGKMITGDLEMDGTVYRFNEGGALTEVIQPEEPQPEEPQPEEPQPEEPQPEDPQSEDPQPEDPQSEVPQPEDPQTEDPQPEDPQPVDPDPQPAVGWTHTATGWVYLKEDGTRATGWLSDGGSWYYMNDSGYMLTGWVSDGSAWYYMKPSGAMTTGWVNDGGTWYYMKPSGAMATGWLSDGGTWYYMKPSGAMATGWVSDGGAWYYMKPSGTMTTGWMQDRGTWYYFRSSGTMVTGWQKIGGTWYYFRESGAMATGWYEEKDAWGNTTAWYWFDESGAMATGWKEINGQWEMFADSGAWLYTYQGE